MIESRKNSMINREFREFFQEHDCQKGKLVRIKPCTQKEAWTPIILF